MRSPDQHRLPLKPKFTHGGRRPGAGRPNRSGLKAHVKRPEFTDREPLHVTLKLRPGLPGLRRKGVFDCLVQALSEAKERGLHVVHFAILSNHVHLILDPPKKPVSRLLQSFSISFARRFNRLAGREGGVFLSRYDLVVLRSPTQVRNALAYVLTNESKHRGAARPAFALDPFSSAILFKDWRRLLGESPKFVRSNWSETAMLNRVEAITANPKTWLLRTGWTKAGPLIS
jgi:REP element-mobilizing transposase RayT